MDILTEKPNHKYELLKIIIIFFSQVPLQPLTVPRKQDEEVNPTNLLPVNIANGSINIRSVADHLVASLLFLIIDDISQFARSASLLPGFHQVLQFLS